MNTLKNQEQEIATIQERKVKLNLSYKDCERLSLYAGKANLTVGELLENFIGDLVDGTYNNGSDERRFANEWFDRCYFSQDKTFLKFLIEKDELEDFRDERDNIEELKNEIAEKTELLETGKFHFDDTDAVASWKDFFTYEIVNGEEVRLPVYKSEQEYKESIALEIKQLNVYLTSSKDYVKEMWEKYILWSDKKDTDMKDELGIIENWTFDDTLSDYDE